MSRTKWILLCLASLFTLSSVTLAAVMFSLQKKISHRLEKGWVIPPLEVYSQGLPLAPGRKFLRLALEQELQTRDFHRGRDFEFLPADQCARPLNLTLQDKSQSCFWFKPENLVVTWDEGEWIREIWRGPEWAAVPAYSLFPRLITQFYDGQPILQENTPLSEIPLYCLQAATAIEDKEFLEHRGVSATGILRAMLRNLRAGRFKEGGSTITQQLVKNFFLDSRKTIRRKVEEQLLALMLEAQISKDQIFEMYLNVIYMGQEGPYQVRGFGSASRRYFDKPIGRLDLPECALLGALINSPGRYSPFEHPDAARARRELVLAKMREEQMISDRAFDQAKAVALPKLPASNRRSHAPYFVMSALKEFQSWDLPAEEGARLDTTLDPEAQLLMMSAASRAVQSVESRIKKPSTQPLQMAVMSIDVPTAEVLALTGGRDYRTTQYNRALDSRRQIGSVVKPFVYLQAFAKKDALTPVSDDPFEWKVGRAVWKPRNYDGRNHGLVPYFVALAQSLNIPTARLGQEVGLDTIADGIKNAGIRTPVPHLPSLTLGAFELAPWEVAQGYTTLARLGAGDHIHTLRRVENIAGEVIFERSPSTTIQLDAKVVSQLVGAMKQTFNLGTARSVRELGIEGNFAGKTGSTSDSKDAWFVGFNSRILTVVWIGYDDNTAMGLTGASAALPVWADIIRNYGNMFEPADFAFPDSVEKKTLTRDQLLEKFPQLTDLPDTVDLQMPAGWAH